MDGNADHNLQKKWVEAVENKRRYEKSEARFTALWTKLKDEEARCEALKIRLASEKKDYDRLENKSLRSLFYSVLGNRKEKLDKEKGEWLAARLAYDSCRQLIASLKNEISALQMELEERKVAPVLYNNLLRERETYLSGLDDDTGRKLRQLYDQLGEIHSEIKETDEAIDAGSRVIEGLEQMIRSLEAARNWGTWDLLGGGMMVTGIKHSKIEEARKSLHSVQHDLVIFNHELKDIREQAILHRFDRFTNFADYFFDGLIVDWVVQSGINRSLRNVEELHTRVNDILQVLQAKYRLALGTQSLWQQERQMLLQK